MNIHILVAGPGTGKTSKIIERIKHLQNSDNLLVISFTNATVRQLRKDIKNRAGVELSYDKCTTLHSLALRLASPGKQYILMDSELALIQRDAKCLKENYEKICESFNCKDFNQTIRQAITYVKTNPVLVKERLGQIDLLLVDEFQDFNSEEQELIKGLAYLAQETFIAGDDDQSIYDFKNANPQGIIDIYNNPENFHIEHAGICHRCPDQVVQYASNLIKNNPNRVEKKWICADNKKGFVCVAQFLTKDQEENAIISKIKEIVTFDSKSSILVLYPNEIALHNLQDRLRLEEISFNEFKKDIKKFLELRHLLNIFIMRDSFLHLRLLLPKLDVNLTKQFYKIIRGIENSPKDLKELIDVFSRNDKLKTLVENIISPLLAYTEENILNIIEIPAYQQVKEAIGETTTSDQILEKIDKFIEEQIELHDQGINLMTIHKSKGLEADYVFLMGATEGVLPMIRPKATIEGQRRLMYVAITRCKKGIFISTAIEWDMGEKLVHKVQKDKFQFDHNKKVWLGKTSSFIGEMGCTVYENFDLVILQNNH